MSPKLNATKALIFRIVHRDNVPWILDHGIHCGSSGTRDSNYVSIGNSELISKRMTRPIPVAPGGVLSDYVPFYFTPYSPMLLNIKTGYNGIRKRANHEIVILVSSLKRLRELDRTFVFSDRHAYLRTACFSSDMADLSWIDWDILQRRDFKGDPNDPEKIERYQAEALVHQQCPVEALLGVGCYDANTKHTLESALQKRGMDLKLVVEPRWYF